MKKKTKTKIAIAAILTAFLAWFCFRPVNYANDTFFKEKSLNVPAKFIVSHESPFMLKSVDDYLVLKIPNNQAKSIQKIFASQQEFRNINFKSPTAYRDFVSGYEDFFPSQPSKFQAGDFTAFDGTKNNDGALNHYFCRFLFVQHNADLTYLYLSSSSPIN